ncbi:hypothetical protein [Streptomyces sp. ODS28]|uniref:ABC transporter substrate-binding protein n=1 Tax=Streptomyces sp. ODS28 TaxID=3136688 RepID=UPI0031E60976
MNDEMGRPARRPRFHVGVVPRGDRFPKRRTDWWRPAAVVAALLLVAFVIVPVGVSGINRLGCIPGTWPTGSVWRQGGECVGVSDSAYDFSRPELSGVMKVIGRQNRAARDGSCKEDRPAVKIGALVTARSAEVGDGMAQQLEGIAAAQARSNGEGCTRPVRLLVGQAGSRGQAAPAVARRLADEGAVAVVGMGLSQMWTVEAAGVLSARKVPMVGAVMTGEGFDRTGSHKDRPDFAGCRNAEEYRHGIGGNWFYRVAYRNKVQIDSIARQAPDQSRFDFIVTPDDDRDPYTCTTLPLLDRKSGREVPKVRFDSADEGTVQETVKRICDTEKHRVNVFYAARAHEMSDFLAELGKKADGELCDAHVVTVVSTSDAARIRAGKGGGRSDPGLRSKAFTEGRIQLLYPPLADPGIASTVDADSLKQLTGWFDGNAFPRTDLNSGWAVNGFDAMTTAAQAVNHLTIRKTAVTGPQVNTRIGAFTAGDPVQGAGGKITFDGDGNRADAAPTVVQLCPPHGNAPPRTAEVQRGRNVCGVPRGR